MTYVLRPELLDALILAESNGNPNAVSPKGAFGLGQAMPETARNPGYGVKPLTDVNNPQEQRRFAKDYATALLNQPEINGNEALMLAAYNSGLGRVNQYGGVPPYKETQGYLAKINNALNPIASANAEEQDQPAQEPSRAERRMRLQESLDQQGQTETRSARRQALQERLNAESAPKQQEREPGYIEQAIKGMGTAGLDQLSALTDYIGLKDISKAFKKGADFNKQGMEGPVYETGRTVAQIAPYMMLPEINAIKGAGLATKLANLGFNAANQGGLAYALTPGDNQERENAMKSSAIGYGVGSAIGSGLSKLVGGATPSEAAKRLMAEGAQPTLGQGIEKTGIGKTIDGLEQKLTSLPLVGDIINHARDRGGIEALKATFNKNVATLPLKVNNQKVQIAPTGSNVSELLDSSIKQISKSYDDTLKGTRVPVNDVKSILNYVVSGTRGGISRKEKDILKNIVAGFDEKLKRADTYKVDSKGIGTIDAADLKILSSDLWNNANKYSRSIFITEQEMGGVLKDAHKKLKAYRQSFMSPEKVAVEGIIDQSYGAMKIFEDANSSARAQLKGGSPTAHELMSAVSRFERKKGTKGNFSRGQAKMAQDIIDLDSIIGNRLPNSMTTDRLLASGLASAVLGGTALYNPEQAPALLGLSALALGGSTRPVQKYLLGGFEKQAPIADFFKLYSGRAGAGVGANNR